MPGDTQDKPKPFTCMYCEKKFDTATGLKKHMGMHNQNLFNCNFCNKSFAKEWSFNKHLKTHKEKTKSYNCSTCTESFFHAGDLLRHIRTCVTKEKLIFECNFCQKKFSRWSFFNRHLQMHESSLKLFNQCNSDSGNQRELLVVSEQQFACSICPCIFNKKFNLDRHMKRHLKDIGHACKICEKVFTTKEYLMIHMRIHSSDSLTCAVCKNKYTNIFEFNNHIKNHSQKKSLEQENTSKSVAAANLNNQKNLFVCSFCHIHFFKMEDLERHVSSHRRITNQHSDVPLHADPCNDQGNLNYIDDTTADVAESDDLMEHDDIFLENVVPCEERDIENCSPAAVNTQNNEKKIFCDTCQACFTHLEELKTHEESHSCNSQCQIVKKVQNNQADGANFICDICHDHFVSLECLQIHSTNHSQNTNSCEEYNFISMQTENLFICDICHNSFINKKDHDMHVKSHVDSNMFSDGVNVCQDFVNNSSIQLTNKSISVPEIFIINEVNSMETCETNFTETGYQENTDCNTEQSFICNLCQNKFMNLENLDVHVKSHTNYSSASINSNNLELDHRFKCGICQNSFVSLEELNSHSNSHQHESNKCQNVDANENTATIINVHKNSAFICGVCQNEFECLEELDSHLRSHSDNLLPIMNIHSGSKPFICGMCQSEFTLMEDLRMHVRSHSNSSDRFEQLPKIEDINLYVQHLGNAITSHENSSDLAIINLQKENTNNILQDESNECQDMVPIENTPTIMNVHTGRSFICGVCQNEFECMEELNSHLRSHSDNLLPIMNIHSGSKPFICGMCQSEFTVMDDLDMHVKSHASSSDRSEQFTKIENINLHEQQHTNIISDENTSDHVVICFQGENTNNIHQDVSNECQDMVPIENTPTIMNVYTGRSFICGVCQNEFQCMEELHSHLRSHSDNLSPIMSIHTGNKPLICGMCQSEFTLMEDLDMHMRSHASSSDITEQLTKLVDINSHLQKTTNDITPLEDSSNLQMISLQEDNNAFVCGICQNEFGNIGELEMHVRSHGNDSDACVFSIALRKETNLEQNDSFVCNVCHAQFVRNEDYGLHIQSHTSGANSYQNPAIPAKDATTSSFGIQDDTCGDNLIFDSCQNVFNNKNNLEMHLRAHAEGNESCQNSASVVNETNFPTSSDNSFICELCQCIFTTMANLNDHMLICSVDNNVRNDETAPKQGDSYLSNHAVNGYYICNICQNIFSSLVELNNHTKTHTAESEKNQTSNNVENDATIITNLDTGTNFFLCQLCKDQFMTVEELRLHLSNHLYENGTNKQIFLASEIERNVDESNTAFMCGICQIRCSNLQDLTNHLSNHVTEYSVQDTLAPKSNFVNVADMDSFICNVCNIQLPSNEEFNIHLTTHTTDNVTNQYTPQGLNETSTIKIHNPTSFVCGICQSTFDNMNHLGAHLTVHDMEQNLGQESVNATSENSFSCNACQSTFVSEDELNDHLRTHEDKEKIYQNPVIFECDTTAAENIVTNCAAVFCDICQCHFISLEELQEHLQTHTLTNNEPECVFNLGVSAMTAVPLSDKPFVCGICGQNEFLSVEELDVHLNFHLTENNAHQNAEQVSGNSSDIYTSEQCFTCNFCQCHFSSKQTLDAHLESHVNHSEIQDVIMLDQALTDVNVTVDDISLMCNFCDSYFENIYDFQTHIETHTVSRNEQASSVLNNPSSDATLICNFCCANCDTVENLDLHMASHVEPLCQENLLNGSSVAMDVDVSPEPLICTVCQNHFSNINDLNIHFNQHRAYDSLVSENMLQDEIIPRSFICGLCQNQFQTLGELDIHLDLHAQEN